MPKMSDADLAMALDKAYLRTEVDKQLKLDGASKKGTKINWYDFATLRATLKDRGVLLTDQAIRSRIYSINKGIAAMGQAWKAQRPKGAKRTRKPKDYTAFLR